ncbi:MAG: 8-amino-7-oxononanoate synthase [Planctomycetota bacterium]|jgi:8-amino-7-oxononanoate synthase
MDFRETVSARLAKIREKGLYRELKTLQSPHRTVAVVDGAERLLLNSNDYLGLANHPRVLRRAEEALRTWGFGSPASRLISGHMAVHRRLEEELASLKGEEDALLFSSGYMTNLGVLTSLVEPGDLVVSDEHNHASIVDACRLTRADVRVYPHGDVDAVREALASPPRGGRSFVVTDAVFSMDGDVAPLPALREAADAAGAWLVVDEAHATGVLGETGRGIREHFGGAPAMEVVIGTLGKALGGQGGFAAGSKDLVDLLRNRARTFFYSTALLPVACAGVLEAMAVLREEPGRVASLRAKARRTRERLRARGLDVPPGETPIVPVLLGGANRAVAVSSALMDRGYFVTAIRPPTVAEGTSRLRVVVNEPHTDEQLEGFADSLAEVCEVKK